MSLALHDGKISGNLDYLLLFFRASGVPTGRKEGGVTAAVIPSLETHTVLVMLEKLHQLQE